VDASGNQFLADRVRSLGGEVLAIEADVSKLGDVQQLVQQSLDGLGRIDTLFNNAGIAPHGNIQEPPTRIGIARCGSTRESMYRLLTKSYFSGKKGGVIPNTCSPTLLRSVVDLAAYTTSKGAVLALTRSMAMDCAQWHPASTAFAQGP
jgi:NAD(P)-dependent dehydrogenase (short-subunit alcohol dehydrogenase family)